MPENSAYDIKIVTNGTYWHLAQGVEPEHTGRRARAFAAWLCWVLQGGSAWAHAVRALLREKWQRGAPSTVGEAYAAFRMDVDLREILLGIPLTEGIRTQVVTRIGQGEQNRNPSLHPALQDLADEIIEDIREALGALDDPDMPYPGVDPPLIDPVPDEHVKLVIWAMQRELNRETRDHVGMPGTRRLPAAPLAALPWRVQRALVERRRLRYLQWGVTRQAWMENRWNMWQVWEDPNWVPRYPRGGR